MSVALAGVVTHKSLNRAAPIRADQPVRCDESTLAANPDPFARLLARLRKHWLDLIAQFSSDERLALPNAECFRRQLALCEGYLRSVATPVRARRWLNPCAAA